MCSEGEPFVSVIARDSPGSEAPSQAAAPRRKIKYSIEWATAIAEASGKLEIS
jgi:hypothetical protein